MFERMGLDPTLISLFEMAPIWCATIEETVDNDINESIRIANGPLYQVFGDSWHIREACLMRSRECWALRLIGILDDHPWMNPTIRAKTLCTIAKAKKAAADMNPSTWREYVFRQGINSSASPLSALAGSEELADLIVTHIWTSSHRSIPLGIAVMRQLYETDEKGGLRKDRYGYFIPRANVQRSDFDCNTMDEMQLLNPELKVKVSSNGMGLVVAYFVLSLFASYYC